MRKTLGILALLVFGLGTIACEAETNIEETEALFENLEDTACDGCGNTSSDRTGNGQ